ncbi:MAG: hypothetical protein ABFQ62_05095 [Patescibacteria group bacterium]
MNTKYLQYELDKLLQLMNRETDAFISRIGGNFSKVNYLDEKVLPVIKSDINFQTNLVVNEAERLLKEKDERKKDQTQTN